MALATLTLLRWLSNSVVLLYTASFSNASSMTEKEIAFVSFPGAISKVDTPTGRGSPLWAPQNSQRSRFFRAIGYHESTRNIRLDAQTQRSDVSKNQQLEIGVCCQGGSDPQRPQKVNQDAFFHTTFHTSKSSSNGNNENAYTVLGVLDGHGLKGHLVSNYLSSHLPSFFQYYMENLLGLSLVDSVDQHSTTIVPREELAQIIPDLDLNSFDEQLKTLGGLATEELPSIDSLGPNTHHVLLRTFHSAHRAAMLDTSTPAGRNGATCVMLVLDHGDGTIHVAHVGDSRAISVLRTGTNGDNDEPSFEVTPLTTETTVKLPTERERIEQGEGTIRGNNVFYGPVGIAMTRSLGNAVMLRAGVVPTPIVEMFSIPQTAHTGEAYIVLGTDGIWDVLSNDVVAELLTTTKTSNGDSTTSSMDAQAICECISSEARKKWVGDLPIVDEEKVDDITCIVVRFT